MKLFFKILVLGFLLGACSSKRNIQEEFQRLISSPEIIKTTMEIEFKKGEAHNHPSFAIWLEDLEGNYIETLFVTQYVATGTFGHGEIEPGRWKDESGIVRRPATLPYWAHKRGIKASDGLYVPSRETAVPDAISSATPLGSFKLETGTKLEFDKKFRLLMEINQPWDSNEFWTNNKFPGDMDYYASLQPALVYSVILDPESNDREYYLNPIGHSHPSGKDGTLFTNLTTFTTAMEIIQQVKVSIK